MTHVGMGCAWVSQLVTRDSVSPEFTHLWQLRTLYWSWDRVEVVRVLMLDPS